MLKKESLFLLLLMCITFPSVFAQKQIDKNMFFLSGKITGQKTGKIYLQGFFGEGFTYKKDSTNISNGRFQFEGIISDPVDAFISLFRDGSNDLSGNSTSVFLEPSKMTISLIKNHFDEAILTGSKSQNERNELNKLKAALNKELRPLSLEYNKLNLEYISAMRRTKDEDSLQYFKDRAVAAKDAMDPYYDELDKIDRSFITKNPASYVTASMMRYKMSSMTAGEIESIYNKMPVKIQQSSYGKNIVMELEKLKAGSPGAKAFVFKANDINGNSLSLANFKGKYVLLDFWASWCVPCRKGNPHLISIFNNYHNKGLEIIGISDDDSKPEAWKKAVEKDEIGIWHHVLRGLKRVGNEYDKSNDISEHFGIHTLPTKVLINKEGIIIGRYGGGGEDDEAMDKKLREIFEAK